MSLEIHASESVAITGPSGCGKSTLLHLLGGLDRPTHGEVYFRGEALAQLDLDRFRARQVGFVFQSFYLMPALSAIENIQIPMFEMGWPPDERLKRATELIESVGLGHRPKHRPSQLSVGGRQRVAIARSATTRRFCSPTSRPATSTPRARTRSSSCCIASAQSGLTLVIVTHSQEVAKAADRQIQMRDGQVQASASPIESSHAR